LLEEAKRQVGYYSYKKLAAWLTQETGRPITANGVEHRIKKERKGVNLLKYKKQLKKEYERILKQIDQIEKESIGTKEFRNPEVFRQD
jgi:hypothetical protein